MEALVPCIPVARKNGLELCSARMDDLAGYRFSDLADNLVVLVDPRLGFRCCELAESMLPVLIHRLAITRFTFSITLRIPQPYKYEYSRPSPGEKLREIAREAERLGLEARAYIDALDPTPLEHLLVLSKVLAPSERGLEITEYIGSVLLALGRAVQAWLRNNRDRSMLVP